MRILDRYLSWRVINAYCFILAVFTGLYLVIDLFSNLPDILQAKPSWSVLAEYYLNSLPLILLRVSPFALLIGTLYTFADLNKNNEIISLRSCGLNVVQIALPVIIFALLISTSLFFLQEKVLIYSQKRVEDIKTEFIKKKNPTTEETKLAFASGNMIFFVQSYSPQEKVMKNVIIFEEDQTQHISKKIVCSKITYEYGFWIAHDMLEYELDKAGKVSSEAIITPTKKLALDEKPNDLMLKKGFLSEFSSLHTLNKRINSLKKIGESKQLSDLIVDYHRKIVEPFTSFFLIIGIMPMALEIKKRKAALSSLGVGFLFSFIYYYSFYFYRIRLINIEASLYRCNVVDGSDN